MRMHIWVPAWRFEEGADILGAEKIQAFITKPMRSLDRLVEITIHPEEYIIKAEAYSSSYEAVPAVLTRKSAEQVRELRDRRIDLSL